MITSAPAGISTLLKVMLGNGVPSARLTVMVYQPALTEDLVQEVCLRVWTRAEQWQGSGSVGDRWVGLKVTSTV